jgi:hypothetical protein
VSGSTPQPPDGRESGVQARAVIAALVVIVTIVALTILGAIAIASDKATAITLFNIMLPVMATWVGTVLAFYFGRENFESANKQVRATNAQLVQIAQRTQRELVRQPITEIMRPISAITYGLFSATVTIADLRAKFTDVVTRLPVLTSDLKPLYMIHASSVEKYLNAPTHLDSTLQQFIDAEAQAGNFAASPSWRRLPRWPMRSRRWRRALRSRTSSSPRREPQTSHWSAGSRTLA